MTRDPLTSTVTSLASSGSSAERAASMSATLCPEAPNAAAASTRELADREQAIAAPAGVLADLLVQGRPRGAELGHVAEHENPPAAQGREVVERGMHGAWIRVVAVVDDRGAVATRHGTQPAAHGRGTREPGHDVLGACADGLRRRRGCERVRDVRAAEQRQPNVRFFTIRTAACGTPSRLSESAARRARGSRRSRKAEGHGELATRASDPIGAELVVGVDDGRAGTRQGGRAARPSRGRRPRSEPKPSRWASAAFVMTPTVGCARPAR